MLGTIAKLQEADSEQPSRSPFGPYEEEAIVSLALEFPEFFTAVGRFLKPQMFEQPKTQYVMAEILQQFETYGVVPSRRILRDKIERSLTEDDPYAEVLALVDRPADHREVPIIKDTLLKWTRDKAYGLIYSEEAQDAYARGDYSHLEKLINEANRIADVGQGGFWFFENYKILFDPEIIDHRTTGFPKLDRMLNNGGPSPKEVLCWLAATNVGKSIVLCNNAMTSLTGTGANGQPGQDVLLITFELDTIKTAMRCLGAMINRHGGGNQIHLDSFGDHRDFIERRIQKIQQTYNKRFCIVEWPPEECSVNHIYALLDSLKRMEGWHPDVIIIDYMDLMMSRTDSYNENDYSRQKHVANEIRGLARNENVLIFTATQTNRSGSGGGGDDDDVGRGQGRDDRSKARSQPVADLNKAAESFAKQFSLDYVVSLNQSRSERKATPPRMRMYIAKNRNGPKNEVVDCTIEYETMVVREQP